ncbi:MAG: DNA cytosine methyltransferase [Paraclostridium sp.]
MNVLSLFDGISCGMIALERANIKIDGYYSSEIEKGAIEISNKNYPEIIRLGDVVKIDDEILKTLPKIDLILAGSPCQGFSRNGNMLNFENIQSKLFFDFIRILNWIRENNNKDVNFILENVEMKKEWRNTITEFVGVEPIDINSNLLSAQNRPRTYWSNIEGIKVPTDLGIKLKDVLSDIDTSDFIEHQGILVDNKFNDKELNLINVVGGEVRISQATKQGYIVANDGDGVNLSFPTSKTRRGRVIKQKTNTLDKQCNVCVYYDGVLRKLMINELEKLQTLPTGYTGGISEQKRRAAIGNGWTIDVIAHILKGLK